MAQLPERIVEVRIGPPGGTGRVWRNPTFIEATAELTTGRKPNKSIVKIWNLSDESRDFVQVPGNVIQVLAGVGIPGQFFQGDITERDVGFKIEGENRILEIPAADGRRRWREAIFSGSYPGGTTRDRIMPDVFAAMAIPTGYIASLAKKTFSAGWAYAGRARGALTELLGDEAGWSIQAGRLQIVKWGTLVPGNVPIIRPSSGMIGSPTKKNKAVSVKTDFTRDIWPGGGVRIESDVFEGDLKVTKAVPDVNSEGTSWQVAVTGITI